MKIAVFSAKAYDQEFLDNANQEFGYTLNYFEAHLNAQSVQLAAGHEAVCVFTNDLLNEQVLAELAEMGVLIVALRCAGYNNVDLEAAKRLKISVVRVPAYSPYAVAEHTVGLMLTLSRKFHKAYNRVREGNFTLNSLLGFDFHGKTVGVVGTGKIGCVLMDILLGFGCRVLAYDLSPRADYQDRGVQYTDLSTLFAESDVITLHCPLTPETHHLINPDTIATMKRGVMLINTSRGGVIDTKAVIDGLKSGQIGYLGLDVYEEEADIFFEDLSGQVINDDILARLLTFPNVLVTGHQAFFTREALTNIACTTLNNIHTLEAEKACENEVCSGV